VRVYTLLKKIVHVAKNQRIMYLGQMDSVYQVRRTNLRKLMTQWGGPTSLAAKLGHSNGSFLAQLAGPHPSREVSEKVARQIELDLSLPSGWMDLKHKEPQPLDDAALALCIRAVAAAAEGARMKVPPEKFADVVALAYDNAKLTGGVDEAFINRIVRLLK